MQATELIIDTEGLTNTYGDVDAVGPLDLKIRRGEGFGFLGHNGAGKTTISMLTTLISPTAGRATVDGLGLSRDALRIKERIGYPKTSNFTIP